jgi:hypothetical protein
MAPLASLPESSESRREVLAALRAELSGAGGPTARIALDSLVPSEIPALDRLLGGGFPRGTLVTLEGSAGRWSIAARLVASVTRREIAAIVDDGGLYPPSLAQAGARLDRVLVVPARTPLGVARAVDVLLRSRACRLILLPAVSLRDAVWVRLAGLAHRAGVLLIAIVASRAECKDVRAGASLAAASGLRLHCALERVAIHGTRGLWCSFAGFELRAELRKHKRAAAGACVRLRAVDALDGAALRERILETTLKPAGEERSRAALR